MFFGPLQGIMGASTEPIDSWDRLVALQDQLRALGSGGSIDRDEAASSRAIRARLAARAIEEQIAEERARVHREGRAALETRMRRLVEDARSRRNNVPTGFDSERRAGVDLFWSPVPVLAFRAWSVGEWLRGAVGAWIEPFYRAGCWRGSGERLDPAVPHTDGDPPSRDRQAPGRDPRDQQQLGPDDPVPG